MTDTSTLMALIDARTAAQRAVAAEATAALRKIMVDRGWSAVALDVESVSDITRYQISDTGQWVSPALDELDILRDELFPITGNVPRTACSWSQTSGDYIITSVALAELMS